MSLLDIEASKVQGNKGIEKKIDDNAMSLVLDTLQITQYVHPESSTVRELVSNSVDSQKEKEKVLDILNGKAKSEDYWLTREDPKYKDSNFNKDYYDINYLDIDNNTVEVNYIKGKDSIGWCDKFVVKDYGVGIGGKRLEGCLSKLGFSTKRNSISQIGGWGYGGKVSLSLRNDYYTTETCHNGKRFKFNSYSYKVDSLIGKFNDKGEVNKFVTFDNGSNIYYEDTNSKNYTEITVPCKRHHYSKICQGVTTQLMYFEGVNFTIIHEDGTKEVSKFKADVIYNSENLIIANQYQYSRPHVIVVKDLKSPTGVNYGYIQFKEMEMQDLFGSVGFKCPARQTIRDKEGHEVIIQEGVELLPSREGIVYSDHTRDYIKKVISKAADEASTIVENELKEKDFIQWLYKAQNVLGKHGNSPILNTLSKIVDVNSISPKYSECPSIKFDRVGMIFWGLNIRDNSKRRDRDPKTGIYKDVIARGDLTDWYNFNSESVYLQEGNTSNTKDFYLAQNNSFITIRIPDIESLYEKYSKNDEQLDLLKETAEDHKKKIDALIAKRDLVIKYLRLSSTLKNYDTVDVPEDWAKKHETLESTREEEVKMKSLTPAELRKLNEQTIVNTIVVDKYRKDNKAFGWEKYEPKTIDFINDAADVYYGFGDDEDQLHYAGIMLFKQSEYIQDNRFYNNDFKLLRVSQSMPKKYLVNHTHISKLFRTYTLIDKEVGMSNMMVKYNTGKLIFEQLSNFKFMENYEGFNKDIYDLYQEVKTYSRANYKPVNEFISKYPEGTKFIEEFHLYCEKVNELQLYIRDHSTDAELIKAKSEELFNVDTVEKAIGLDLDMYDKLQLLVQYSEPIKNLFNHITVLTTKNTIDYETEQLINEIIHSKSLDKFQIHKVVEEVLEVV